MAAAAHGERVESEPVHRPRIALLLVVAVGGLLAVALVSLPRESSPLPAIARYAMEVALPKWHTTEPVNEIVYGTRGFDTFGETFLLLAAVVCLTTITRAREPRSRFIGEEAAGAREEAQDDPRSGGGDPEARSAERNESDDGEGKGSEGADGDGGGDGDGAGDDGGGGDNDRTGDDGGGGDDRRAGSDNGADRDWTSGPESSDLGPLGRPGPETAQGMTSVLRGGARVVSPALAVAGIYLVAWGYSPGGGFPGGAVMAGIVLVAYACFGYPRIARVVRPGLLEPLEMAGALVIIGCELFGLVLKGSFSANWLPLSPVETIRSGGILQRSEERLFVCCGLGLPWAATEGLC